MKSSINFKSHVKIILFVILCFSLNTNNMKLQRIDEKGNWSEISLIQNSQIITNVSSNFILGADISSLPQVIDGGGLFFTTNGTEANVFDLMEYSGFHYARLRLWVDPVSVVDATGDYCNFEQTLRTAQLIKASNWSLLLDFHYSDWWADPGHQKKPSAWENLSFNVLMETLYKYTYQTLVNFSNAGIVPDLIQTGNEIAHGMLWPDGKTTNMSQFVQLLNISRIAIHDFCFNYSLSDIPIIIHNPGDSWGGYEWFFDSILDLGAVFDIIATSYYPKWHGTLHDLGFMLNQTALKYNKKIMVVETNYPSGMYWINDESGDYWAVEDMLDGYPATPQGQRLFFEAVIQTVINIPHDLGIGLFLWEPAWVTPCIGSSPTQSRGLFNLDNQLLEPYQIPLICRPQFNQSEIVQTQTDTDLPNFKITGFSYSWSILFVCVAAIYRIVRRIKIQSYELTISYHFSDL